MRCVSYGGGGVCKRDPPHSSMSFLNCHMSTSRKSRSSYVSRWITSCPPLQVERLSEMLRQSKGYEAEVRVKGTNKGEEGEGSSLPSEGSQLGGD